MSFYYEPAGPPSLGLTAASVVVGVASSVLGSLAK